MAIDFPNSPTVNDIYTVGDSSWEYDGEKWLSLGVTGPTGATGADGSWATVQEIRSVTGATDTPTLSDNGKLVTIDTTSGGVGVTINSSLNLPTGCRIDFLWVGAASSVTFSLSGVTLNGTPGLKLRSRYSGATLTCIAANTYVLVGDLSA